jgi:hypothetical protein
MGNSARCPNALFDATEVLEADAEIIRSVRIDVRRCVVQFNADPALRADLRAILHWMIQFSRRRSGGRP